MSTKAEDTAAAVPLLDGHVIKTGEVIYKGKAHTLTLWEKGLKLVHPDSGTEAPFLQVSWRDVVCACPVPVKTAKSTANKLAPSESESSPFLIHYIVKNKKTSRCRHEYIQLMTKDDKADSWISKIEHKRKEGKPQKLMIVINPIGGKKIGRQLFEKLARPLFTLAGIELDVIVTERAGHATDIANNLNPSSIDGLVVVGGDGMYMEVMEPLLKKAQDEARVNVDNPNAQLAKPQVRIGILPAGTGNVVSGVINGIIDFETATLNVIRGETDRGGVFSIHEADTGALIHYSGLLIGYGLLGDILDRSQTLRWMKGRLRYAYVLLTKCFGRKRMYNIDVEVLREKPYGSDVEKQSGGKANSHATGWTRLGEKRLTTLMALTPHLDVEGEKMEADLFTDGFHSCLISSRSGFQLLSIMIGLMKQKRDTFNPNYTEVLTKIQGLRFKLNEEKGRRSSSHAHYISRALTVDGEMRTCSANGEISDTTPHIEIRYHPHMILLYNGMDK